MQRALRAVGHVIPFAVHGVLCNVFCFDGLKSTRTDVQGDVGCLHPHVFQLRQQSVVKMQRRCGRRHGTRIARKHCLITALIFGNVGFAGAAVIGALDVGWQRHMAVLRHQGMRLLTQSKAKQRAFFVRPAAREGGRKSGCARFCVLAHVQHAAYGWFFTDLHVRHHLVARQHAFNQEFHFATRRLLAKNPRLDHLGVVENQQIAGVHELGQGFKNPVDRF